MKLITRDIFKSGICFLGYALLLATSSESTQAQHFPNDGPHTTTPYVNTTIDAPQPAHWDNYKGRDEVKLEPGALITNTSRVYLDPSIQAPVTYSSNPDAGFGTTLPELDKDLDVGTIPGQASVNLMGGASYTIPFDFPKGSGGVVPQISLSYNSGGGMGIAGLGWNLNGLHAISRAGRNLGDDGRVTGVSLSNDDWFLFDGAKLIPETQNGADNMVYHTQVESFSRIISHTSDINQGPDWWEIITKDGTRIEIGNNTNSKLVSDFSYTIPNPDFNPNFPASNSNPEEITISGQHRVMWMVNKVTDRSGNYIIFDYDNKDNKELVLKKIIYSGNANASVTPDCEVNFYYSITSNKESFNVASATIERTLILRQIESKINGITFNKYDFEYVKSFMWEFLASLQVSNKDGRKFNKTVFNYEQDFIEDASNTILKKTGPTTFGSISDNGDQVLSLDYNGDGLKDLVSINDGFGASFGWKLYKNLGEGKFEQVDDFVFPNVASGFTNPSSSNGYMKNKSLMKQVVDFDGNGLEDFYMQINFDLGIGNNLTRNSIGYTFNSNGTTMDASLILGPISFAPDERQLHTFLADMNGDTRTDLVIFHKLTILTATPPHTVLMLVKDIANGQEYTQSIQSDFDFSKALAINRGTSGAQVIDGIIETVITNNSSYQNMYQLKLIGSTLNLVSSINYSFGECSETNPVFNFLGDFNGDGYTDKLAYFNNSWFQSTLFESSHSSMQVYPGIMAPDICSNHIYVADVNADGKSDIVQLIDNSGSVVCQVSYLINGEWITINTSGMGNSVNLGSFSSFRFESVNFTDVDGDGTADMIFKAGSGYNQYWYVHYFKRSTTNCFLKTVRDGLGKKNNFIYDLSSKGIVNRDPAQNYSFPNNVIGIAGKMVKIIESDNGIGGYFKQSFHYDNPVINRYGKGFLGYKSTTVTDIDNGLKSIADNKLITNSGTQANLSMLVPEYTYVKTTADVTQNYTHFNYSTQPTIIGTYTNSLLLSQSIVRSTYMLKATGSETFNSITGASSVTSSVTNDDGNVTSTASDINNGLQENNTTIEYDDDPVHLFTVPYLPKKLTKTSKRGGGINTSVTEYEYNNNHELLTETNLDPEPNNNTNYENTVTFEYNPTGSLKKQISTNDVASNTKEYFYDAKNKNLVKEINSLGQASEYTYDALGNVLLSSKSITNLISTAEYDGWFRTKKTVTPSGAIAESKTEWASANEINGSHPSAVSSNLNNIVYKVTSAASGAPAAIIYYDVLGRPILTASESITNTQYSAVVYNSRGNVYKEVGTYQNASNDPVMVTTYTYSNLDRKVEASIVAGSMGLTTITEETGYNAGTTEVILTKSDGKTEKKYTDASGKLVKVIDNQGLVITYEYNNITAGNKNEIITRVGGDVTTHAIFDEAGNQVSLNDKQAGETTYEYNGAGQMTKQTDPVGHIHTLTYMPDGRLLTKTGDEGTYTYIYEDGNNGKNKIKELQGPNGSIKYYYNNLQWLVKQEEIYPWETFTSSYEYDMYGHQTKYTYPNGFAVNSVYNSKGYLTKMERADNGSMIWQLNETNFNDAVTKYEYGNGVQVTNIYNDLGMQTEKQMPGVIDFIQYGLNHQNGNLNTRALKLPNVATFLETFTYDEDRLQSHTYDRTNAPIIQSNYDNFGKIENKSDAGSLYSYNGRNRLLDIENPENNISTNEQNIIFNSFKRPETITEGDYELSYTYGPDRARIKGELKYNGTDFRTRLYANKYEINDINNGPKHEICYISSPNGLCAMYVKENGATSGTLNYTYTDNLGSILAVTDETGAILARQNFDAWGRRRNAQDYTYLAQNTTEIHNGLPGISSNGNLPVWLYRGFTGHEMLDEFTLIHMNARLYDPIVGMMLSCDNYISDVTNTQDYQRYSYARNNPLKYIDPDGNEPITFAIAATVGAAFGGVAGYKIGEARGATWGHGLFWYTMAGAGIGAAAGVTGAWIGGAAAGGMGAVVGSTLGGASAGATSGAGFYTLGNAGTTNFSGSGLLTASWKGAVSGAAGGFAGSAVIGGALGGFLGGAASASTSVALNGGGTFEDYMTQIAMSGGFGFAFGGAMSLAAGKNFFTGRTTLRTKTKFYVDSNKDELIKDFGEENFKGAKIRGRRFMVDLAKTFERSDFQNGSGEFFEINGQKHEGFFSKINISARVINDFYYTQSTSSRAIIFHEFFHANDNYTGFSEYINNTNNPYRADRILELRAYRYEFNKFGTGYEGILKYQ